METEFTQFLAAMAKMDNDNTPATRRALKKIARTIDLALRQAAKVAPDYKEEGYFSWLELCHLRRLMIESNRLAVEGHSKVGSCHVSCQLTNMPRSLTR